ncbi:MAG TPA: hypothetical protein VGK16_02380 [Candidatus Limnocylindrales bacterium]
MLGSRFGRVGCQVELVLSVLRRVGIFIGSLIVAALVMGLVSWVVMVPMGQQLLASGTGPLAAAFILFLTIVLGGLIYREIMEREDRSA